ncbi:hypothetical protein EV184_12528 [Sinorhizobium americanum]|uniref:Uncharacterized protein n=1 Tax=Sinorhizobium americanum TaxID=194963 RepID=A0A4R2B903_9HYPH|nr:hypothetical protein EV184_12528 [Sinorhizobium americanum]
MLDLKHNVNMLIEYDPAARLLVRHLGNTGHV